MKHQFDVRQRGIVRFHAFQQVIRLDVIVKPQRREVAPLFIRSQVIGDEHILDAALVEVPDQRAADEPGAAGDEDFALGGIKCLHGHAGQKQGKSDPVLV